MTREELIKKWLDNDLSASELEAFKALEDYDALTKLSDSLQRFKAPDYDVETELEIASQGLKHSKTKRNSWLQPLLRVAAVAVIAIGIYFYTTSLDTNISTDLAEQVQTFLPDNSEVSLNANSTLSFNKSAWSKNREVSLNGEAFFKVAKGSKFEVITPSGVVSVLGTEFNVKQRGDYFEVYCHEGLVGVKWNGNTTQLTPGKSYRVIKGTTQILINTQNHLPTWLSKESSFENLPIYMVFEELERQYKIKIETQNIDLNQLFNGSFTHGNLEIALKSITIPLNLTYTINNDKITIIGG